MTPTVYMKVHQSIQKVNPEPFFSQALNHHLISSKSMSVFKLRVAWCVSFLGVGCHNQRTLVLAVLTIQCTVYTYTDYTVYTVHLHWLHVFFQAENSGSDCLMRLGREHVDTEVTHVLQTF